MFTRVLAVQAAPRSSHQLAMQQPKRFVTNSSTRSKKVKDFMTARPECVDANDTMFNAAQKMKNIDTGVLPVCERDPTNVIGIVTDRDMVVRGLSEGKDPKTTKVQDVMTKGVHRVYADDDLNIAEKVMKEHQIRRVCVFDRNSNKLSGILSMHDFATSVDAAEAGQVIKKVSM